MKLRFTHDIYNAGTIVHAKGDVKEGDDLARYVRRGQAVELKDGTPDEQLAEPARHKKGRA